MDTVTDAEAHAWLSARNFELGFMGARKLSRLSTSHAERPHPLLVAAESGDLKMCQWLFDHGADRYVSVHSNHYWTPMMRAASRGHAHVCEWLIAHGASQLDIERPGSSGYTCMHWASRAGSLSTCRMLYRFPGGKRTVRQSNDAGWRPLRIASQHDQINTCLWLIAHGAADSSDDWCSNGENEAEGSFCRYVGMSECVSLEIVSMDLPDGALGSGPSLPKSSPRPPSNESPLPSVNSTATTRQRRTNSSQSNRMSVRARVIAAASKFLELYNVFVHGFVLGAGARTFSDGSAKGNYSGNANCHDIMSRRIELRAEVSALSGPVRLIASYLFEYGWPLGPCITRIRSLVRVVSHNEAQQIATAHASGSVVAATHTDIKHSRASMDEPSVSSTIPSSHSDSRPSHGSALVARNQSSTEARDIPSVPKVLSGPLVALASASAALPSMSISPSSTPEAHATSSLTAISRAAAVASATVRFDRTVEDEAISRSSMPLNSPLTEGDHAIASTEPRNRWLPNSALPLKDDNSGSGSKGYTSNAVSAWLPGWSSATATLLMTVVAALSLAALLPPDHRRQKHRF